MIRIGFSLGDPAGVGAELLCRALASPGLQNEMEPLVFGDEALLARAAERVNHSPCFPRVAVTHLDPAQHPYGFFSEAGGRAQVEYLRAAADALERNEIDALVTGPLHKRALKLCGETGPGQTEWLEKYFHAERALMMLAGPRLKVVLVTKHMPLREVPAALTPALITDTVQRARRELTRFFFPAGPRLALAALNPHGEENGQPGREEREILIPAAETLRAQGFAIDGPLSADSLFARAAEGAYDAVVALYHDQGLGPLKALHFHEGVNVTLGLGRVRTSPDHGVAYDLAGTGRADPRSLMAATRLAVQMVQVSRRLP